MDRPDLRRTLERAIRELRRDDRPCGTGAEGCITEFERRQLGTLRRPLVDDHRQPLAPVVTINTRLYFSSCRT
jgi:hypothetical protein